ncbi:MAG: TRAP transporter small permease [Thermoanaerobaculales bacterium]|jgi:TRAP-type C4-dicarboxylate transport system permease small subunit|nr:TRAP transporter small permease [Thermoanaerobaculales bacterium]
MSSEDREARRPTRPAAQAFEGGGVLGRSLRFLGGIEDFVLVLLLAVMIGLAGWQIIARNLLDTAVIWGDPLLRVLVLWVGFFGAVAASRDDRQINVDVVTRVAEEPWRSRIRVLTDLFTAAVSGFLAWHAVRFVRDAEAFGETAFGSVPLWLTAIVLPLAFGLLCFRYLLLAGFHLRRSINPETGG